MSLLRRSQPLLIATIVAGAAACVSDDDLSLSSTATSTSELDVIGLAERPAALLVLSPSATPAQLRRLEQTLTRLGGGVLEMLPPRLVIAQVPAGAETALSALGVVAKFERAVAASDLASPTLAEERFLSVYSARWFPAQVPTEERLVPTRVPRPQSELEAAPQPIPAGVRAAAEAAAIDPEDTVSVPFGSGKVVVSIILPESNGAIDPSTEDWNEALIRETYLKVQAGLDKIASADPNADLRFVLHYESSPTAGGLPGTVDTGYEFGQRAQWGSSTEFLATADILGQLLDREVAEGDVWNAALEYDAALKRRYDADAAFFVIVAANGNYTASLRAHAFINGPWTVLDTSYGWETFTHEFGHIYGALDEYCPDQCVSPSTITGYLGMYNANAASNEAGGGIDNGRGEAVTSLMEYNNPDSINGYTRGAWGWLDTDGDGIIEVRDTLPKSELTATVSGQNVRLTGQIIDRGDSRPFGGVRYSANRIVALEYAFDAAGPWFREPLPGATRGRETVDLTLTGIRAGSRRLYVRGVNSVGNVEPRPLVLNVTTTGSANTAPHLRLNVPLQAGSSGTTAISTLARDLDNDTVQVRYDLDGNGSWDTGYLAVGTYSFTARAGVATIKAQARDARGATRIVSAELPVVSGVPAPALSLSAQPSLVHGAATANLAMTAAATSGSTVKVVTELLTNDEQFRQESAPNSTGQIALALPTPPSLKARNLDLTTGDPSLAVGWARDLIALDANTVMVAGGTAGLWILDVTDRAAPRVLSRLALETSANHFFRSGNLVYVLGTYLTVVDISSRTSPRELKQSRSVTAQALGEVLEPIDVADGGEWPNQHSFNLVHGAKISSTRIELTIDHPRPADLLIKLVPSKDLRREPIVLWDHRSATGGLRTLVFTSSNTPTLRALDGMFADGFWSVEILDDQANGQAGRLVSTRVQFSTTARAVKVIDNASQIAGRTSTGSLVIAGSGLETLDVSSSTNILSQARLTGSGTQQASMSGNIAIVSMGLQWKNGPEPRLRGLCAVNLSNARSPQVIRCETTLGEPFEHVTVGSRLYAGMMTSCSEGQENCENQSFTIVGDTARFTQNLTWRRGTTPLRIDRSSIGTDQQIWTVGQGFVQDLNVSNPAAVAVRQSYPRTYAARLVRLSGNDVVLFQYSTLAQTTTLGDAHNILSRIYRVSVEARNNSTGRTTRAYRTVHVVPYDQAPTSASASVVPGKSPGEPPRLRLETTDPNGGTTWDTSVMARIDWDSDGAFDTNWYWLGNDGTTRFFSDVDIEVPAGTYNATVEARDGFWGRYRRTMTVVIPAL